MLNSGFVSSATSGSRKSSTFWLASSREDSFFLARFMHARMYPMSRKGNCYDNCIMETFFGRMKNEMFYGHEKEYSSFETFAKAVDGYINYYNNERIQEKTKWMPPTKFREASMCT